MSNEIEQLKQHSEPPVVIGGMFVKYFTCPHWLWFDRFGDSSKRTEPSSFHEMLLERGLLHEEKMLTDLDYEIVDNGSNEERFVRTVELMEAGVERIYHGILMSDDMIGEPDLLERNDGQSSKYGAYHYVPVDIKSAERVSEGMRMQLSFYADLLGRIQGRKPKYGYILNGSGMRVGCELSESRELYDRVIGEIRAVLAGKMPEPRLSSGCRQSPWFKECIALAEETHDVTLLYNVKSKTLAQLRALGVRTIEDAAVMDVDELHEYDRDLKRKVLVRAKLQAESLVNRTHFFRKAVDLPAPPTEIYFDIESDPLRSHDYLFGFLVRDVVGERYEYQLADTAEKEGEMWREFLRWAERLPEDYVVYHFGTFETARLAALENHYGGSQNLDRFRSRMIDLNEIVKENVTLPLYFYGIKDIGRYIGFERNGAIAGGGESVAVYEHWLESGDRKYLDDIIDYNRDDVIATRKLKDWLISEQAITETTEEL
ncbi:MAG: TM0106 family RecB-like putative nuclease [Patescibacteria group bacterium]